jgi:hypothetical protein
MANISSSRSKRHSRPDVDSRRIVDKPTSRNNKEEEKDDSKKKKKKANISRKLSLSTEDLTEDDGASPSSIEQSLIAAFKDIQISSLKPTVKTVESNLSKPKVLIRPETSSCLARDPTASTRETQQQQQQQHPSTSSPPKSNDHSKWKTLVKN